MHPFNQYEQVTARHEARRSEAKQSRRVKQGGSDQSALIIILTQKVGRLAASLLKSLGESLVRRSGKLQEQPAPPETGMLEWVEK